MFNAKIDDNPLKHDDTHAHDLSLMEALVKDDLERVNAYINGSTTSHISLIPEISGYLISSGGKRLRPMLTLISARALGYADDAVHKLAACVELIHSATLLHDDVVDESLQRRGAASANDVWGNKPSVLVGDFLFSRSFQLMVGAGSMEALHVLSNASAVIAEGEVMQLSLEGHLSASEVDYMTVIDGKTAALFAAACEVAAVVADSKIEIRNALSVYGKSLGRAFQIVDDVLDYSSAHTSMGKTPGDDFREGKLTLPIIKAYENADAEERAFWTRTIHNLEQKEGDFARAQDYINNKNILATCIDSAKIAAQDAKDALSALTDTPARTAMAHVIDFCTNRNY